MNTRKLLNTLYVMTEDAYLTLDGENVVVVNGEATLGRIPLHTLENIICFTYKGASPAFMGTCADRNIGLSFYSPRGKFLARVKGKEYGNVLLRKEQYRISDSLERSTAYAKNMILGKVYNCRWGRMPISAFDSLCRYFFNADIFNICHKTGLLLRFRGKISA